MTITEEIRDILARGTIKENLYILPEQLDRKTYEQVNKVLEALGGKWNRKLKGHSFAKPMDEVFAALITEGEVEVPADFDFHETSPDLAAQVIAQAEIKSGMLILEPSAGNGALARPARYAVGGSRNRNLICIDIMRQMVENLWRQEFYARCEDFLSMKPEFWAPMDRIVMNPPFSKNADVKHVAHALSFLKPKGLLVSIMSAAIEFRNNAGYPALRDLIRNCGGSIEPLPEGAFKHAGTKVRTVLVTIPGS